MIAIGTTKGIVLAFASPAEVRGVAQQLIGMAEWHEEERRPGPVLWSQFNTAISEGAVQAQLEALKGMPVEAVRGGE